MFIGYVIAYLDRVNVGFAKLAMLDDLHFSDAVYGFGAGLFFVSYFLFEVPSNLILQRVGVRRWISRIMISWGLVSAATAWVKTPEAFYALRFLLGVAEAGFFPGMVLYLTYWFPSHRRGKMMAVLMSGNPVSGILGGLVSGFILHAMHQVMGLAGWQWLFIIEAAPAVLIGVIVLFYLDDRVEDAKWLDAEEKAIILRDIKADNQARTHHSLKSVFVTGRVWLLCLILFGIIMGSYAVGFWQPSIIRSTGINDPLYIGLLTMIPYGSALGSMIFTGQSADRRRERRWHLAIPAFVACAGFTLVASVDTPFLAMVGLTMAACGVITALPMFWALPTSFLGGTAAAAGIAFINCSGNFAGFVSPTLVGWLKDMTHSMTSGLGLVAASLAMAGLLVLVFIPKNVVNR
jgi:MFS family permease